MKYRDHKGGLEESMETVRVVKSEKQLIAHLNTLYDGFTIQVEEIKFEHAGYDKRTGWNTYYVLQRFSCDDHFTIAGMSNGKF